MEWNNWEELTPNPNVTLFLYDSENDHFAYGRLVLEDERETMEIYGLIGSLPSGFYVTHWAYPIRPGKKE